MSTSEITAYLFGADCGRQQLTVTQVFLRASWKERLGFDPDLARAHIALGNDRFAYWVRRGMDEAGQWQD